MNRYWLFGGELYYPAGGAKDLVASYPTLTAAVTAGRNSYEEGSGLRWWNVLDVHKGTCVAGGRRSAHNADWAIDEFGEDDHE